MVGGRIVGTGRRPGGQMTLGRCGVVWCVGYQGRGHKIGWGLVCQFRLRRRRTRVGGAGLGKKGT